MKQIYLKQFDIAIAGGGMGGAVSAVAAAREGANVLMIEQAGYLGGALTSCGVGPMMTFHAANEQVILGIGEEIIQRLKAKSATIGHIPDSKVYCDTVTPFNSEALKVVLEEMLIESGCTILYHTFIGAVNKSGDKIESLTVCNKDGLNPISAKVYIDATGDADVACWAGAKTVFGRKEDGIAQPMTMNMKYCGVDTEKLREHVLTKRGGDSRLSKEKNPFYPDVALDTANFKDEFKIAREKGELSFERGNVLMFSTDRKGEFILNTTRILDHDATDAVSLSEAEIIGRKQCEELDRFMKKYAPGFEDAILEITGPSVGIRSSRQLVGQYVLTADDLLQTKQFPDTIAHSGYPIDIHNPKGAGGETLYITGDKAYYSIPYRIMVCDEVSNLIVTGRCVSSTFEAQAAIRTTPTIAAMGQASGIAGYLASKADGDTRSICTKELQELLVKQGAFLDV